eukprot:754901-Hanusia_phi.AAC.5
MQDFEACMESRSAQARMVKARCQCKNQDFSWISISKGRDSDLYMETHHFPEPEISISKDKKIC